MRAALVAAAAIACIAAGDAGVAPVPVPSPSPSPSPIPADTTQLVTGVIDDWSSTTATLRLWRRGSSSSGGGGGNVGGSDGAWAPVGAAWPGVIGYAGAAWGDGLHGSAAPPGEHGPTKREGDGASPAGAFVLDTALGYAASPPKGAALPYTQSLATTRCVDDPASPHYGQIVDDARIARDWRSSEVMRRGDELYTWVVTVAHNAAHATGGGSCIFLHAWRDARSTTTGCTAMAQPALAHLVGALDAAAHPVYVLLPRAEYRALAHAWGLPAL